jgi:poly(3-hydroxybutyrate) depolymerase
VPDRIDALCIYVHGTYRDAAFFRDGLSDFAEAHHCLILAPLFPAGIIEPDDVDNYKFLLFHGLRFDTLLLQMVAEVRQRYAIAVSRFLLGGFSGGAQFAHRFFYLHPQQVQAVSVAAPGRVTMLDADADWWSGVRNVPTLFNTSIDLDALCTVPVQLSVGSEDIALLDEHVMGNTRLERVKKFYAHYQDYGLKVCLDVVAGAAHEGKPLLDQSIAFFESILEPEH